MQGRICLVCFLPGGHVTAANLLDASFFGHVSLVVGYFPHFLSCLMASDVALLSISDSLVFWKNKKCFGQILYPAASHRLGGMSEGHPEFGCGFWPPRSVPLVPVSPYLQ